MKITSLSQGRYTLWGIVLLAIKYQIDRFIAVILFHLWSWYPASYFQPVTFLKAESLRNFYLALLATSLPFIGIGIWLTLRRLRDIGWPLWLCVFFFVPFLNLIFFLILCIKPSGIDGEKSIDQRKISRGIARFIPVNQWGSAAVSVLITCLLTLPLVLFGTEVLKNYGWGLFVGIPFFQGMLVVFLASAHRRLSFNDALSLACLPIFLSGIALLAVAAEGLICLLMAAPIGIMLGIFGGFIGWAILDLTRTPERLYCALWLCIPFFMIAETRQAVEPPLQAIVSRVTIKASPEKIWDHVIAFSDIPPPQELIFKTGISYPTHAVIDGRGVGAIRHCVFSTGSFTEPITVWDEPRLLRFDVSDQPSPMTEWSPYGEIQTAHLRGYFQSHRGQFHLIPQSDGTTVLEGTTWYTNRMWPQAYWQLWSNYLIHTIHMRVLNHIKEEVESMETHVALNEIVKTI